MPNETLTANATDENYSQNKPTPMLMYASLIVRNAIPLF